VSVTCFVGVGQETAVIRPRARLVLTLLFAVTLSWSGLAIPAGPAVGRTDTSARLLVADFTVNDGTRSGELRELDPMTLAEVGSTGAATPVAVAVPVTPGGTFVYREWAGSADGTTAVTIEWPREDPIRRFVTVRRGIDGPVVSRFDVAGDLGLAIPFGQPGTTLFSADGSRLVLLSEDDGATPAAGGGLVWSVFDTADGRRIAEFRAPAVGSPAVTWEFVSLTTIDPAGERLYRLAPVDGPGASGPYPARLIVHDLATGAEVGSLDLPDVQVGERSPDNTATDAASTLFWPGFAISPDGRELAVVRPDGASIVLIDTQRLAITRTLTPATATPAAAEEHNVRWLATYAAGGEHLLVTGFRYDGRSIRAVDLQRIDLTSGQLVARAPLGGWVNLWPSADGRSIYVASFATDDPVTPGLVIRRLDAFSLATEAERILPGRLYAVLWLRVPGSQLVTIWF
jgi:hypothetical protein